MALQLGSASNSSLSSSFSFNSRSVYDVFLSFRGEDVRHNFLSHLYDALYRKGIYTYIDDNLERGEQISLALFKAIEASRISIIILSEHYASSTWCLDELMKILECKKTKQQMVLPVFYKVDPSIVRKQKESYGEALANYEHKFNDDMRVERWKAALKEVANLSGLHLEKDGNEAEFIKKIIQWVDSIIINRTTLEVAKYPVGIESRVQYISSLLCMEKKDIVHKVGIFGVGGIGKTTIAKAVYNKISSKFEGSCFLKNIRETSQREDGLVQLQKKLLSDILGASMGCNIDFVDRGTNVIKERLRSKRILLILDDVDEWEQLKVLAGDCDWFGLGSRIVITTRDQHLLTNHEVEARYELERLNHNEAFKLFSLCAFKKGEPPENYVELTKRIIGYGGGLPLALELLGSDLHGRSIQEWESALDEYKTSPHKKIQKILRISFDSLRESEKNIFLDIACFFKGYHKDRVIKILDSRGFCPNIGVKKLMDKCLITIDYFDCFEMHDLLRDMGREIVREESPKKPGKRSRLHFHEDICRVLEGNMGTDQIEGMLIDLPKKDQLICLSYEVFRRMTNLKYFINCNARFSGGPNYLSNELIVLDWMGYPSQSLPENFHGQKLVDLRISNSLVKDMALRLQNFHNLTRMDFSFCEYLTKIPDVSRIPNLEWLDVADCHNLVEVHASVGSLNKLEHLSFVFCTKLTSLPRSLKFRYLKCLSARDCSRLQNFPEIEFERECLRNLNLARTDIKELPLSIGNLTGLEELDLSGCKNLHLPTGILRFRHLKTLCLTGCSKLVFIPNILKDDCCSIDLSELGFLYLEECHLPDSDILMSLNRYFTLQHLNLSGSDIIRLPESITKFVDLRILELMDCKKLEEIPALPHKIEIVDAKGCISLERFPDGLKIPHFFRSPQIDRLWINLSGCHKIPTNIERFWENTLRSEDLRNLSGSIIFQGNRIPDWFSNTKQNSKNWTPYPLSHLEASSSEKRSQDWFNGFKWSAHCSSCRITINGLRFLENIRGFAICVVLESILDIYPEGPNICFKIESDGVQEEIAETRHVNFMGSGEYVWLHYAISEKGGWIDAATYARLKPLNLQVKVSSVPRSLFIKSCGVHLIFKNEKEGKDHSGFLPLMDGIGVSKSRRVYDDRYLASTSYQQPNSGSSTLAINFEFQEYTSEFGSATYEEFASCFLV